jgi:hypothetical protein
MEKTDAWHHDISPPSRQQRLESLTNTLRSLADTGLGAASILANLHHRRIVPLMEREHRIYEMNDAADPTVLAHLWLLHDRFAPEYAATRAKRAISLRSVPHGHDDLWSFIMLPDAPTVSEPPFFYHVFCTMLVRSLTLSLVEGDCGRRAIRSTDAPGSGGRPRCAAAGTRAGGA